MKDYEATTVMHSLRKFDCVTEGMTPGQAAAEVREHCNKLSDELAQSREELRQAQERHIGQLQTLHRLSKRLRSERDAARAQVEAMQAEIARHSDGDCGCADSDGCVSSLNKLALAPAPAAEAQPIPDDSLMAQVGEIGNQLHNLGCERQNDEDLAERLGELRDRLWTLAKHLPAKAQGVPYGWKLVPVEPTQAMFEAFADASEESGDDFGIAYAAMLDAAPAKGEE